MLLGPQDGSADKDICSQVQLPEFYSWYPLGGRKELNIECCSLVSTCSIVCMLTCPCAHTHMHTHVLTHKRMQKEQTKITFITDNIRQ